MRSGNRSVRARKNNTRYQPRKWPPEKNRQPRPGIVWLVCTYWYNTAPMYVNIPFSTYPIPDVHKKIIIGMGNPKSLAKKHKIDLLILLLVLYSLLYSSSTNGRTKFIFIVRSV